MKNEKEPVADRFFFAFVQFSAGHGNDAVDLLFIPAYRPFYRWDKEAASVLLIVFCPSVGLSVSIKLRIQLAYHFFNVPLLRHVEKSICQSGHTCQSKITAISAQRFCAEIEKFFLSADVRVVIEKTAAANVFPKDCFFLRKNRVNRNTFFICSED
ncbi:MAG: hypothetical protein IJH48_07350 [Oscillospiraceae bacterium]|nr:hypothetical protein [Oscillospiraceae bacterium]